MNPIVKEGQDTIKAFLDQLDGPNDIYKQIVVEEYFKIIFEMIKQKKPEVNRALDYLTRSGLDGSTQSSNGT